MRQRTPNEFLTAAKHLPTLEIRGNEGFHAIPSTQDGYPLVRAGGGG